jgi:hypothetical protein
LAVLALAVVGGADALAHDYRLIRQGQKPDDAVVIPHILNQRKFSMRVGETVTLVVHDISDPPCTAKITAVHGIGTSATISPDGSKGFVPDQPFTITAKSLGETTFQIGVVGEAARVPPGRAECNENSINDVVVTVEPNPAAAELDGLKVGYDLTKTLKLSLSASYSSLKTDLVPLRADAKSGAVTPLAGTWNVMNRYFDAQKTGSHLQTAAATDFRSGLVDILSSGGYTPVCEPRGFGPGSGGVWENGLSGLRTLTRAYDTKLSTALDKDMALFEKLFNLPTRPFLVNCEMCCDDGDCPPYPTLSSVFAPPPTTTRLNLFMLGAVSTYDMTGTPEAHVWAAGCADPAKGNLKFDILGSDGFTTTKTQATAPDGTFRINFDGLGTGLGYELKINYESMPTAHGETRKIVAPWIRAQF